MTDIRPGDIFRDISGVTFEVDRTEGDDIVWFDGKRTRTITMLTQHYTMHRTHSAEAVGFCRATEVPADEVRIGDVLCAINAEVTAVDSVVHLGNSHIHIHHDRSPLLWWTRLPTEPVRIWQRIE